MILVIAAALAFAGIAALFRYFQNDTARIQKQFKAMPTDKSYTFGCGLWAVFVKSANSMATMPGHLQWPAAT